MSGVWVFKNGVAHLIANPTKESLEQPQHPAIRRRLLVYLPSNQVITSYAELEQILMELGWERYNGHRSDLIQYHRSAASLHLISLPKDFANFRSIHMYDIVIKNRSFFEVREESA